MEAFVILSFAIEIPTSATKKLVDTPYDLISPLIKLDYEILNYQQIIDYLEDNNWSSKNSLILEKRIESIFLESGNFEIFDIPDLEKMKKEEFERSKESLKKIFNYEIKIEDFKFCVKMDQI